MSKAQAVELRLAYVWDCEDCGVENFERAVIHEFSAEEHRELREEHGVDDAETGEWMTPPDQVTCKSCGAHFEAKHFRADDDSFTEFDRE